MNPFPRSWALADTVFKNSCHVRREYSAAVDDLLVATAQPQYPRREQQMVRYKSGTAMATIDLTFTASRRPLLRQAVPILMLLSAAVRDAFAADVTVTIDNFAFSPTPVVVARGTTVIWDNRDDIPHALYFPALDVRSKLLDTNDSFRYRFDQQGTFDYICSIHPHMRGRVVSG